MSLQPLFPSLSPLPLRRHAEAMYRSPGILREPVNHFLPGSCPDRTAITLTWVQSPGFVQNSGCIAGSPRTNGFLLGAPVTLSGQRRRHAPKSIKSVKGAPAFAWLAPGSCQETKKDSFHLRQNLLPAVSTVEGRDRRCGLAGAGGLKDANSKEGVPVAVTDHL